MNIKKDNLKYLNEVGRLDVEKINKLPFEEYMDAMGQLGDEQIQEYLEAMPLDECNEPVHAVEVDYTLEDELLRGAVIADSYIKERLEKLQ